MRIGSTLKWVGMTLAGLTAAVSSSAFANAKVETLGGINVTSGTTHSFNIGGLLQMDQSMFAGSADDKQNQFPNSANIRRARVSLGGNVGEHWSYFFRYDFKPNTIHRALVTYTNKHHHANVTVGQQQTLFSMENIADSGNLLFIERALPTVAFSPADGLGISANIAIEDMFTVSGNIMTPAYNQTAAQSGDVGKSDRVAEVLRVTFSPVHNEEVTYHLGVSGYNQRVNNTISGAPTGTGVEFNTYPEAYGRTPGYILDTGVMRARRVDAYGYEAAAIWGPALLQAEYIKSGVKRHDNWSPAGQGGTAKFHGWQVAGAYMLTGESHLYDFGLGIINRPKSMQEYGAWEVAARYSFANLNNKDIAGAVAHDTTLGVNWYVNQNVSFAANYVRVDQHPNRSTGVERRTLDIFGLRAQVAW